MSSKSVREKFLELLLPAIAALYGLYALGEQYFHEARYSSLLYTLIITIPILLCGVFIARNVFKKSADSAEAEAKEAESPPQVRNTRHLVFFIIGLIVMISLLSTLGYVICFSLFLILSFRGFGITSWKVILPVTAGVLLFVYLVFVVWLELEIPTGIWSSLLNLGS